MKILRLLVTDRCNRRCSGCCNKQWDLTALPVARSFAGYDQIILTGGEPMLIPARLLDIISQVRHSTAAPVFVYTAKVDNLDAISRVWAAADGLTVTLHSPRDVSAFLEFNRWVLHDGRRRSLRLNVFKGVVLPPAVDLHLWRAKTGIVWLKDCPLPDGEVFMRHFTAFRGPEASDA